jgi:hypothetical protein
MRFEHFQFAMFRALSEAGRVIAKADVSQP